MSAHLLGELLSRRGSKLSVAESLTGGGLAMALVDTPGSGDWFAGGIVAYRSEIKYSRLGVRPGPVITADAAQEMARGASELFHTEVAIATTGCAGPESMEGQPVGTVWIGIAIGGAAHAVNAHFDGDPARVRDATIDAAIDAAVRELRRAPVVGEHPA